MKIGVNRLRSLEEILKEKDFYKEEHFWVGECGFFEKTGRGGREVSLSDRRYNVGAGV